jgi:hypothetical protein
MHTCTLQENLDFSITSICQVFFLIFKNKIKKKTYFATTLIRSVWHGRPHYAYGLELENAPNSFTICPPISRVGGATLYAPLVIVFVVVGLPELVFLKNC